MNKSYKEQYKQETQIECGLADSWGYKLVNTPINSKEKKHLGKTTPIVANITLRKFNKKPQKTQKIKQVQDEIRALENERMLRQLRQGKQDQPSIEQKSEIIKLMQKIIQNYNDIVEHKHLKEKDDQKINQHHQDDVQKKEKRIINQIKEKKKQLINADLSKQIKINKQIANIYKDYNRLDSRTGLSVNNTHRQKDQTISQRKNIKKYQSQTFQKLGELTKSMNKFISLKQSNSQQNMKQMAELFKSHSNIDGGYSIEAEMVKKFKQLQFKRYNKVRKQSTPFQTKRSKEKKEKGVMQVDFQSPYLNKKQMQDYKLMENKIRSNSEVLQLWKNKVSDATINSRLIRQQQYSNKIQSIKQAQSNMLNRQAEIQQIINKQIKILNLQPTTIKNIYEKEQKQKQRKNQLQKEFIFSQILRKKNNKFNKLWGTRILVKYDSDQKAKLLLKGQPQTRPSIISRTGSSSSRRNESNESKNSTKRIDRSQQIKPITRSTSIVQTQDEKIWKELQKDEQHYWRMCKNQKINLLLKRR